MKPLNAEELVLPEFFKAAREKSKFSRLLESKSL